MGRAAIRLLGRPLAYGLVALALLPPTPADATPESEALKARAADELYSLDHARAIQTFERAIAADPRDAGAYRGLASAWWATITFDRGMLTVDSFLGKVTRDSVKLPPPNPKAAGEFHRAIDQAIALARTRLATNARDADAQYQLGAAVGLRASYAAAVEGSLRRAFGAAREAYDAHEKVLQLDPGRRDAGLIVGTYRYVVAALALPVRWVAYMAGFGGGRERGLQLVEAAAEYRGDNRSDARLALVLLYNRERRYDEALAQLATLRAQYPRNRLLWLESGATSLRGGRHAEAERFLNEGLVRLATDKRARMGGEEALWYLKRGSARAALARTTEAERDLRKALTLDGRKWVHGRAHLEIGRLLLRDGKRADAASELRAAIVLCEADGDPLAVAEARALLR
jgi:tetratricopeptide (TPR) repeat protein